MFSPWHRVWPYTVSACELNGSHVKAVEKPSHDEPAAHAKTLGRRSRSSPLLDAAWAGKPAGEFIWFSLGSYKGGRLLPYSVHKETKTL